MVLHDFLVFSNIFQEKNGIFNEIHTNLQVDHRIARMYYEFQDNPSIRGSHRGKLAMFVKVWLLGNGISWTFNNVT